MNRCKKIRRLLSLFQTGDLDEAAARTVRMHLIGCPDCRRLSKELDQSLAALEILREQGRPCKLTPLWPDLSYRIARLQRESGTLAGWIPVGVLSAACLTVYLWGSTSLSGLPFRSGVGIAASTRVVADGNRHDRTPDVSVREVPSWARSSRTHPVLPDARAVTHRPRQF